MRFHLLGPIHVEPQTPSAAKLRTVLSTLLVRANHVVSADTLIAELWGDEPPRTATTTLQVYISQLRKQLTDPPAVEREGVITTRTPGYLINVAVDDADFLKFEQLQAQARVSYRQRDFATAADLLHSALDLWTGQPFSGVVQGPVLEAAAQRLELLRLGALEQRIAADLWLGRHRESINELADLARQHPLSETIHAHLMVALYRSDRHAEALCAYGRLRAALIEELGAEPGPALRDLHQRILRSERVAHFDQCLDRQDVIVVSQPVEPVVRLPRPAADFIGRSSALAMVERMLRRVQAEQAPQIVTVVGAAGVGKTEFAVQVAHRIGDVFPDCRVFVNLRDGDGRPLDGRGSLVRLLRRLGVRGRDGELITERSPGDFAELGELLDGALAGRRALVVLDDVGCEAQVRPIISAAPDATFVITSRYMLALPGARHVRLDVLPPDEAQQLLVATGGSRIAREPAAAAEVARLCGYLPLALRIAGAGLAGRPHWTARMLADRVAEGGPLEVLDAGDGDLRARLLRCYQEAEPFQQRAFRLLGLASGPDFALWSAAALLGSARDVAERVIDSMLQAHLLRICPAEGHQPRYEFHKLLRAMALELLADEEPDAVRAATARLGSAYLALARYADARLAPGRGQDSGVEEVGHPSDLRPRDLVGQSPWRWFQEELPGIVAAVRQCHAAGLWSLTWQLADSVTGYLEASAAWPEWEIVTELALDAARQAGDPGAEATVLCSQGALAWQRRELDRASVCFAEARQRARQVGDRRLDSRSLIGLADVTLDRGMSNRARSMYAVAAGRCGSADDLRGLADALRGWAFAELWRGRAGAAVNRSTECYRVATRLGDRRWSEFARRLVERMRSGAARGGVAEVRPGVWLFGPRPTGAQPPDRDGDPAKSSLALVR